MLEISCLVLVVDLLFSLKLLPQHFRFRKVQGEIYIANTIVFSLSHHVVPEIGNVVEIPILALTRNLRCAEDLQIWIDERENDNLPMTFLRRVLKLESFEAMLKNIGESHKSPFANVHTSSGLDSWAFVFAPKDLVKPFPLAFFIIDRTFKFPTVCFNLMAK